MKKYTFFIYRPIAAIIPLVIFFSLIFLMLWLSIPLMHLISNPYIAATVFIIPASVTPFFIFYVRKKLLVKTVAILDTHILSVSYKGHFIFNKESIIINCSEIYSVTLKKYLAEEYRLTIKYGNKKNEQIVFVKVDCRISVKDDFLAFADAIKKYSSRKK